MATGNPAACCNEYRMDHGPRRIDRNSLGLLRHILNCFGRMSRRERVGHEMIGLHADADAPAGILR